MNKVRLFFLVFLFALLPRAEAVTTIVGAQVGVPVPGPGVASLICVPPAWCPTFFDDDPFVNGRYIGDAFSSTLGNSNQCRISTDGGVTWTTLCAGAYPLANVPREMDVTDKGTLLSLRYEASGLNLCRLDRSTDGGATWTTITIRSAAGTQCAIQSSGFLLERQQCAKGICIALAQDSGNIYTMRSLDDGLTWSLVNTSPFFWVSGDLQFNGTIGVFSRVSGGDDFLATSNGGATWTQKSGDASDTSACGGADFIAGGPSDGLLVACANVAANRLKILDRTAILNLQPDQPTGFIYPTGIQHNLMGRPNGSVYLLSTSLAGAQGHLFFAPTVFVPFVEMAETASASIDPEGAHNHRLNNRDLIFSTNGQSFATTQILRIRGGEF